MENEKNELLKCRFDLLQAFSESFFNERDEFIAHKKSNQYICLSNCETVLDVKCKVLEWFSRPATKAQPYVQEWRNRRLQDFMLDGVNSFLGTNFTRENMEDIYQYLGNAIDHKKTIRFIKSGYDFKVLIEEDQ